MGIQLLIRQFPPTTVLDPETKEMKLVESPIEMWYKKTEAWWVEGASFMPSFFSSKEDKAIRIRANIQATKEELVQKSKTYVKDKRALNRNIRIEIEGFSSHHVAGRYDTQKGLVLILSSDIIKGKDIIQEKVLIEEGPPPVYKTIDTEIFPLSYLITNMLYPRNSLEAIGDNEIYLQGHAWQNIEETKSKTKEALGVAASLIPKVMARGEKIDVLAQKAEDLERNARLFKAKATELADPGCFGWFLRKLGL